MHLILNLILRAGSLLTALILFCAFLPLKQTEAKEFSYSPLKMMLQSNDSIIVKGFRGDIEYVVNEAARDVTVFVKQSTAEKAEKYQEDWQFIFKREGAVVQILVEGPASKQAWSEILALGMLPNYDLRIIGPSRPLHINWNEGKISVANLKSDLQVTALKAKVTVVKSEGDVTISNQEGLVQVQNCKGEIKIDSYLAKVEVENIDGKLDLENFTGESRVQNVSGNMTISSYKGSAKIMEVKGRLEFKNGNSPLRIEKFEGELRGRSGQGTVYAEVRGEANVRVESAEGAVSLKLPSSGAWVNLGTAEGSLAVPNFLKLTRLASQQIRTGRLHGSNGGSIFVRTTSGDIRIR